MDFRKRGWGLLLVPISLQYALLTLQRSTAFAEVVAAVLIVAFAPRVATKAVPFGLLILGWWGIMLVRDLDQGTLPPMLYGITVTGVRSWPNRLVLPEALLFLAAGAWLFLRVSAPGSRPVRDLAQPLGRAPAARAGPGRGGARRTILARPALVDR
jgi:hypothetical protein